MTGRSGSPRSTFSQSVADVSKRTWHEARNGGEAALAGEGGFARIRLASGVMAVPDDLAWTKPLRPGRPFQLLLGCSLPMFRVRFKMTAPGAGLVSVHPYPWKEAR